MCKGKKKKKKGGRGGQGRGEGAINTPIYLLVTPSLLVFLSDQVI